MYKIFVTFIFFSLFTSHLSNAQKTIIEDPNAEVRTVGSFSAISVSGAIDLYLSQGDEDGVAVSAADTKIRDRIKTSVDKGTLVIRFQDEGWRYRSGNRKMVAYVSFKTLSRLHASGASDIYVNGKITGDELSIQLSGASDIKGGVEANKLVMNQSGASDANISGKSTSLEVHASGASKFKGYDFETDNCNARASGASDIQVTVNKDLYANASGASSIYYKGTGVAKEVRSNGASKVNKRM